MYTKLCKLTRLLILFCLLASFAWNPVSSNAQNPLAPKAANAPVPILEQIDRFGGAISDFARNGDILYVSAGQHVFVVDFSDPYSPVLLGQSRMLPAGIEAIDYKDGILYAAANIAGVLVLDVSQPSAPVLIGSLEGISYADSLTVSSEKLLVMDEIHRMVIFDISNPADPEQIGEYLSCQYCEINGPNIPVQDDLVFLIDDTGCIGQTYGCISILLLVSIADPANPMLLSSFCASPGGIGKPHLISSLVVSGQYVYASYSYAAPVIIDISDPASPQQIYRLDDYPWASNLAYYAGYLYLRTNIQRVVIDVSDPTQPTEIGRFGDALGSIYVAGNSLFSIYEGTLSAWDLTDPTAPQDSGVIFRSSFSFVRHLLISKTRLFAEGSGGLYILDITTPKNPQILGSLHISLLADPVVVGNYLYSSNANSFSIFDVSDPAHIIETGSLQSSSYDIVDIAVTSGLAFLADMDNGLHIVDVSDPYHPVEIGIYNHPPDLIKAVTVQDKHLYLGMSRGTLQILDISDPRQPVELGTVNSGGIPAVDYFDLIALSGNFVYAFGIYNFIIYNVSNPFSPYVMSNNTLPFNTDGLSILGRFLFIGSGLKPYGTIHVMDVSDPAYPIEVASYEQPTGILAMAYSGNQLWIGTDGNGLGLLRLLREEASAGIPTYGGSLEPPSGAAHFVVPGRTFSHDVDLTYHRLYYDQPPANRVGIGQTFDLTAEIAGTDAPAALEPGQTISMTLYYTPTELGPAIEDTLGLYVWDGSAWTPEPSSRLDTQANLLTASVDHLGMWAVFGDTLRTYLPLSAWNP